MYGKANSHYSGNCHMLSPRRRETIRIPDKSGCNQCDAARNTEGGKKYQDRMIKLEGLLGECSQQGIDGRADNSQGYTDRRGIHVNQAPSFLCRELRR